MKKVILFAALVLMSASVFAQSDSTKLFQKFQFGAIVGVSGSMTFPDFDIEKPFKPGYCLMTNLTVVTPKTYHNLMYDFGSNSLKFLTGYFIPRDYDVYAVYGKTLNSGADYLGIGIEKVIAGNVNYFLFSEVGIDFKGTESFIVGVLISIQRPIGKKK